MKGSLITLCLVFLTLILPGQNQDTYVNPVPSHSFGEATVSLSPNILVTTPDDDIFAGGIKVRFFVSRHLSFDSDLLLGRNFTQAGPGIIGIPFIMLLDAEYDESIAGFFTSVVLVLLSTEHFAWHIPLDKIDISPYISLLRWRQVDKVVTGDGFTSESSLCFAVGIEGNRYYKRFVISPYIDYTRGYKNPIDGFGAGINIGYSFMSQKW